MNRTVKIIAIALALCVLATFAAQAAPTYNWKLASVLPDSHPVHKALIYFADKMAERTKGDVKITLFPAGQLGQEKDYIEGVKLGSIEFTKVSAGPMGQYSPSLQVVSLPFIWRSLDHQHRVLQGPIGARLIKDMEKGGFTGLAFLDAGFRSITTSKGPINTPADLKGQKIRVMQSKPLIDTINALGGNAVPMGQSEVYTALQTKVIDGWENNEPTVLSFNMQEVAKYYSYTRHSSIPDFFVMSKKVFDKSPKAVQTAILKTSQDMIQEHNKLWAAMIDDTIKQLSAKGMIFNEVKDVREFQKAIAGVWKQFEPTVGKKLIDDIANAK
jgi:tripartite ATP-independent transporter DctP family solute receptor